MTPDAGTAQAPLAILAATPMELRAMVARTDAQPQASDWPRTWTGHHRRRALVLVEGGVGSAAAAAAAALTNQRHRPSALLLLGIGGAYAGSFVPVGAAACAAWEFALDAGVVASEGTRSLAEIPLALASSAGGDPLYDRIPTDPGWQAALARACRMAPQGFATSDGISGDLDVAGARAQRSGAAVESMEGAAVALVCARMGLPFGEVRGISNVAGVRDHASWDAEGAVRAATYALLDALAAEPA
ncbi:MAG: futalosine hydrolase [Trueperaceae bacterium]|nr:futalosine hydrolase [Trueperaceae bacterium]